MPTYITLLKMTDQGVKDIKNASMRTQENIKTAEAMGCKVIGAYAVMGEYDYVGIVEAPNDEVAMALALGVGSKGNIRSTTLKAFSMEEFGEIVKKLP